MSFEQAGAIYASISSKRKGIPTYVRKRRVPSRSKEGASRTIAMGNEPGWKESQSEQEKKKARPKGECVKDGQAKGGSRKRSDER